MLIRPARRDDVDALCALAVETYTVAFGYSFTAADLAAHLAKHLSRARFLEILDEDVVLVADRDGRLIGYVQFGKAHHAVRTVEHASMELRRLYVQGDSQNQRVGEQLMNAALDHPLLRAAVGVVLDVWEHNLDAQRFYRRFGFEAVGTRAFEVASGVATSSEIVMVRHTGAERGELRPS